MKEWKTEKNEFGKECYELHFDQFYGDDEDIIASLVQDLSLILISEPTRPY